MTRAHSTACLESGLVPHEGLQGALTLQPSNPYPGHSPMAEYWVALLSGKEWRGCERVFCGECCVGNETGTQLVILYGLTMTVGPEQRA